MTPSVSRLVCAGCGAEPDPGEPFPFACRNAGRDDDVDHVLHRTLDTTRVRFPAGDPEPNPFIRYRQLLHAYHVAAAGGIGDDEFCALVRRLDARIAAVDGHGFAVTPFGRSDELSNRLGFSAEGGVWVKDETGNVSGSHKARHLFGVLVYLEVVERLGRTARTERPDLAIASCGNAALAAAVVAAAGERTLRVFVRSTPTRWCSNGSRSWARSSPPVPAHPAFPATRPCCGCSRRWPRARCRSRARATSTDSRSRAARRSPSRSRPPASRSSG